MFNRIELNTEAVTEQLERIKDVLGETGMREALQVVGRKVGIKAESLIPPYTTASGKPLPERYQRVSLAQHKYRPAPGQPFRYPGQAFMSKFPSDDAQGGFFGRLSDGLIRLPYRRSGTLGKSIVSEVIELSTGVDIVIGSNLAYAPLVIDRDKQALYHRGTWWTLQDVIEGNADVLLETAERELIAYYNKRFNA